MALPLNNTFETGLTVGTTITTGNSGDSAGNAFDSVSFGAGAAVYHNDQTAHGGLSGKFTIASPAAVAQIQWESSLGTQTTVYGRVYVYRTANPSGAAMALLRVWDGNPGTEAARITWNNTDGKIYCFDSTLTGGVATSVAASLNTWVRVEFKVVCSATAGIVEAKLFNTKDSTTADATATKSSANTLTQITRLALGATTATDASATFWIDDLNVNATAYPGPVGQFLRPSTDSVDGSWTNQAGSAVDLYASIDEAGSSDSDYVQSQLAPTNSGVRIKLASGTDPSSSTDHFIRWRTGKDPAGGRTIDMTVKLYQGGGDTLGAGTLIKSANRTNVGAFATFEEALSGAEADTITNYADLYIEFHANQV